MNFQVSFSKIIQIPKHFKLPFILSKEILPGSGVSREPYTWSFSSFSFCSQHIRSLWLIDTVHARYISRLSFVRKCLLSKALLRPNWHQFLKFNSSTGTSVFCTVESLGLAYCVGHKSLWKCCSSLNFDPVNKCQKNFKGTSFSAIFWYEQNRTS